MDLRQNRGLRLVRAKLRDERAFFGYWSFTLAAFVARLGWDDVPADDAALGDMRAMLADAMTAGALGLSSGLDYPPGSYADTDELVAIAKVVGAHGGIYASHMRNARPEAYAARTS